jgi:hypothetical protein
MTDSEPEYMSTIVLNATNACQKRGLEPPARKGDTLKDDIDFVQECANLCYMHDTLSGVVG